MPSRITQLADAVKVAVNAGVTPSPNAQRVYVPSYNTAKTRAMYVIVVPASERNSEASGRDSRTDANTVYVAVYKKLTDAAGDGSTEAANAEADPVIELAEKIYDLFDFKQRYGGYTLKGVDHSPVFIPQYLRSMGVVVSIIALQFDIP